MPTEVAIYQIPGHPRSRILCMAMLAGIRKVGDQPRVISSAFYQRPITPVCVFYGLTGNNGKLLRDFKKAKGAAVYMDLGYFGRHEGGRHAGYHKISVGDRHPLAYFQRRPHDPARWDHFGREVKPWRTADADAPILLAGMGPKAASAAGFRQTNEWETEVVRILRQHTERPILYRPKPSWDHPRRIAGTEMLDADLSIEPQLAASHAIVSHHSNANVEALQLGTPSFCVGGLALPLSKRALSEIEAPLYPDDEARLQWLADIAWTQFSVAEIAEGLAWRHLKDEGLVP